MSPYSLAHPVSTERGSRFASGILPTRKCGLGPGGRCCIVCLRQSSSQVLGSLQKTVFTTVQLTPRDTRCKPISFAERHVRRQERAWMISIAKIETAQPAPLFSSALSIACHSALGLWSHIYR